jgi:hypothetical protein
MAPPPFEAEPVTLIHPRSGPKVCLGDGSRDDPP